MSIFGDNNKKNTRTIILITVVLLTIVLLGLTVFFYLQTSSENYSSKYQAVFLTNGQVYFGKVSTESDEWIVMENVYYLKLKQSLQGQGSKELSESDVTLAKLGNEIHGPTDMMKINKKQVLFIENLSENSKVLSAIQDHKKSTKENK